MEFYILTHNNLFCAEYQIKTIQRFCKDPFIIHIIDSNCGEYPDVSAKLSGICKESNVDLLKMPNELAMAAHGSYLLGIKLNYVYNTFVKRQAPKYFAFLDQDMFMYKPFSIIPFLEKHGMWGDVMEVDNVVSPTLDKKDVVDGPWMIHPWLSFYKFDFVKDFQLDFMPCRFGNGNFDTGGKMWENFVSKQGLDKKTYWFRNNINMMYPLEDISNAGPHPYETQYFMFNGKLIYGQIQLNNGFIHMLNSPNSSMHPKVAFVKGFLTACLN